MDVSLDALTSDSSVSCTVNATKWVSDSASDDGGIRTDARYSVHLDLQALKVDVADVDEDAARQVAVVALAEEFLKATPTAISDGDITYTSKVNGHQCIVEVVMEKSHQPKHWLVKRVVCRS